MQLVAAQYRNGIPVVFRTQPVNAAAEAVDVLAVDGARSSGLFWTRTDRPRASTAVLLMHPQVDFTRHYAIPRLLDAGYACLGANTRHPNNDWMTVHEQIILDVQAHICFLIEQKHIERVVLVGNSGGGSLFALYQSQALLAPEKRLTTTPGGRRLRLSETYMPAGDAITFLASHRGEGHVLGEVIDPAVEDEARPFEINPTLDMYDERNGFRLPPEWTEYDSGFLRRYRQAQLQRIARLDRLAHEMIADAGQAERRRGAPDFAAMEAADQRELVRRGVFQPVMVIYRTMANPNYVDRRLDPSPRAYGSLMSPRPDIMNYAPHGFARVTTPHAWLSTWSPLETNADIMKSGPSIDSPALVVHAECDTEVYRQGDAQAIFSALGSRDKTIETVAGARHYFEPEPGSKDTRSLDAAMDVVIDWLNARFPP